MNQLKWIKKQRKLKRKIYIHRKTPTHSHANTQAQPFWILIELVQIYIYINDTIHLIIVCLSGGGKMELVTLSYGKWEYKIMISTIKWCTTKKTVELVMWSTWIMAHIWAARVLEWICIELMNMNAARFHELILD